MLSSIHKTNLNKLYTIYPNLVELEDHLILHETKNGNYILPRYFLKNYPKAKELVSFWEDKEFKPSDIDIEFTGKLRNEQIPITNLITEQYELENKTIHGILKAKPGFGKTVCATYLTSYFKKKTLIILNNSKLVEQWVDAYLKFTNITKDDIGYIIGKEFSPKKITITMVQTMVGKVKRDIGENYLKFREAGFDLVFFDETHKTSAGPKFAQASLLLNTKNIIGLSATPYGDELHKFFMKNIIGDVLYEFTEYDETPDVWFINYKSGLGKKYFWTIAKINDYVKRIGFYNNIIAQSDIYVDVIYKLTRKLLKSNRKTIIIVSTIRQLERVIEYLKDHDINARPLHGKEQFIDKDKDNVIVATYKLASHGFDYAELSCLILATPLKGKVSLIQTIGRVLRKYEGKQKPLVFDLIDHDFGNIFTQSIPSKKAIINKEFKVKEFQSLDYNM